MAAFVVAYSCGAVASVPVAESTGKGRLSFAADGVLDPAGALSVNVKSPVTRSVKRGSSSVSICAQYKPGSFTRRRLVRRMSCNWFVRFGLISSIARCQTVPSPRRRGLTDCQVASCSSP